MKIFCILNNYGESADELDWYVVPDSGILRHDNPMFVPDFDNEFRGYPSLIVKICKLGKNISAKFAGRYYDDVAPGMAVQAFHLLGLLRKDGKPWTRAVVFDKCTFIGEFIPVEAWNDPNVEYDYGGQTFIWQKDKLKEDIDKVIEVISRENILKTGDMIMVGMAPESILLEKGKTLSAKISGEEKLQIRFK